MIRGQGAAKDINDGQGEQERKRRDQQDAAHVVPPFADRQAESRHDDQRP